MAGPDDHRPAELPGGPGPAWLPFQDRHRHRFRQEARADRRLGLRGRDEEVGLHYLNYTLPKQGVMPMHCSANAALDAEGGSAIFFGLSGTGKTTLSNDSSRQLLGDDEHGWSNEGIFNFEGGCYAKTIRLSRNAEPEIYATTERFGTVMENVVIDPLTRVPDFDDASLTENTRCAYPLDFIANASATGRAGHPKNIVMLTCDAFGVMPPIAKLTGAEAMYHFLSGYTAKVAGTERGLTGPEATFSTCFGAPFMPRHPSTYGNLLRDLIAKHSVDCWLVNTGWTGGGVGTGRRMPIRVTRRLLAAALDGSLSNAEFRRDPYFGFAVPVAVPGVEPHILQPVKTWGNKSAFVETAARLVKIASRPMWTRMSAPPAPAPRPSRLDPTGGALRGAASCQRSGSNPLQCFFQQGWVEGEVPKARRLVRRNPLAIDRRVAVVADGGEIPEERIGPSGIRR
ncbi:hypothetical protein Lal_00015319 [Lupinus albus]|nr:hypothetical protein Lal_00015319 [Lupinus albus]